MRKCLILELTTKLEYLNTNIFSVKVLHRIRKRTVFTISKFLNTNTTTYQLKDDSNYTILGFFCKEKIQKH